MSHVSLSSRALSYRFIALTQFISLTASLKVTGSFCVVREERKKVNVEATGCSAIVTRLADGHGNGSVT